MKQTTASKKAALVPASTTWVERILKASDASPEELAILVAVGEVFDAIARQEDQYIILGATRDKSAYTFTLMVGKSPTTVYAEDMLELSHKIYALTDRATAP